MYEYENIFNIILRAIELRIPTIPPWSARIAASYFSQVVNLPCHRALYVDLFKTRLYLILIVLKLIAIDGWIKYLID